MEPYWNHIQALELIDPAGPALETYTTDEVWDAAEDLCKRRGIDYTNLRDEVIQMRSDYPDYDPETKTDIHTDLIQFYRIRKQRQMITFTDSPTQCLDEYAMAVFSIAIVSSFVESLFSKMAYNQSKTRNSLTDQTTSSLLHVHDLVLANPLKPLDSTVMLRCNDQHNCSTKLKHKKHIGRKVCCMFEVEGQNDGTMERFHGTVTEVEYHELYGAWMYHVVYPESHGHPQDEVDYWRDQITPLWCTCEQVQVDDTVDV